MGKFTLPNRKIKVKPIMRSRGLITDPDHEAFFLVGSSTINITAPRDRSGKIICPLDETERAFFEDKEESGMSFDKGDLSPYKKERNFWESHRIKLGKDVRILDLANPKDYIDYKLLLANTDLIAPDPKQELKKRTYKYVLVPEDHEQATRLTIRDKQKEAYKFFGKMEDSIEEMTNFLKLYGKKVPSDAKKTWLQDQVGKMIDENVDTFLAIAKDASKDLRLFIEECVFAGIIKKEGRKYFLQGGEPMAAAGEVPLIQNAIEFLSAKANNDIYMNLKARLETSKK